MLPRFLTAAFSLQLHFLLVPRFALLAIGFYPETVRTTLNISWTAFNYFLLVYGIIGELRYGFQTLSIDLNTAFKAICPMLSSILTAIKLFFLWWHREKMSSLIKTVRQLSTAPANNISSTVEQFRIKYILLGTRLTFTMCSMSICTGVAYFVQSLVANLDIFFNETDKKEYSLPFEMMYIGKFE